MLITQRAEGDVWKLMMTGDETERLQGAGQRGMEVVLFVLIVVMIVIDLFVNIVIIVIIVLIVTITIIVLVVLIVLIVMIVVIVIVIPLTRRPETRWRDWQKQDEP